MELLKGIYFYPWESATENNCNTIFIDGDLPALIDPGHAHLLPGLLDTMEGDGISPDGVKLVINTHGHPDHCEGSEWFRERGAMVTISEEEDEFLRGPLGDIYEAMGMAVPTAEPDFFLKEGSLSFGSRDAEILITPGHTPASACIYLADEKVLIVGDLVFLGGVGRVDLPGGNPMMLKDSIARISGLEVAHILPGHGQVISGEENVEANFQFIRQAILQMI